MGLVAEGVPTVSARAAALIVWLAVVNTALAFTWWNFSLRRLSAIASAGINNTMLLQIALRAWSRMSRACSRRSAVVELKRP